MLNRRCQRRPSAAQVLLITAVVWVSCANTLPTQPQNPIMGIVTAPNLSGGCVMLPEDVAARQRQAPPAPAPANGSTAAGCVWSIYVDWLEASGIRVIPIPWNTTLDKLRFLLRGVNGVLFTGGTLSRFDPLYRVFLDRMCDIYDEVIGSNAVGDRIALWGTCQGFQMIGVCAAARNESILSAVYHGMEPRMMAVNFTSFAAKSDLYSQFDPELLGWMTNEKTTLNWHHLGIPPEAFLSNPVLNTSGLVPLSTTVDPFGHAFVSSMESSSAAVYAVQFHPERVMFDFTSDAIVHSPHAIEIAERFSLFLKRRLTENTRSFATPTEAQSYTMANYPVTNLGWGIRVYYV